MERGYSSILTKNALAYNMAYHLKELCSIDDAHKVISNILTTFEYKESTTEENNE